MILSRRDLLLMASGAMAASAQQTQQSPTRFTDVTRAAGLAFTHNSGAFGAKYLPETMGPGCAFLDYDNDGWLDVLLINGKDWPGHRKQRSTLKLYRNNRNGTFTDVTRAAGLDTTELYGLGVAVGDFDNDGFPDLYITCVGQSRLFKNTGKGSFVDVTQQCGLGNRTGFSTSALWFDFDRDGLLDLFVCNYVRWAPENDVFCSLDSKTKSYCTPEAFRGSTCWLFRNLGNGKFEDVTGKSGLFDTSSKALGVAMLDFDQDGWPDLFVANDTQPNKLYRNNRNGTFKETAVTMGVAFSEDGRARAGMGVDAGDFLNSGKQGIAITNFDNEMIGLYQPAGPGPFIDVAKPAGVGDATRTTLGFGCFFFDPNLDGRLDLLAANGHIDDSVRNLRKGLTHAQPPHLFLNQGGGKFRDGAAEAGKEFAAPKIARGAAYGDFDRDGDQDVLITTNAGPAYLYRNDTAPGNQSIRLYMEGRGRSNRDAVGTRVRMFDRGGNLMQMVKSGSSYLSSSEKTLTFGVGKRDRIERFVVDWPDGTVQEFKNLQAGRSFKCVQGESIRMLDYR